MPEYVVVKCFACHMFQCHQKRKDGNFSCKVCQRGKKQSHRKIYAVSHKAGDLRAVVQEYNYKRGKEEEEKAIEAYNTMTSKQTEKHEDGNDEDVVLSKVKEENSWDAFLETKDVSSDSSDDLLINTVDRFVQVDGKKARWSGIKRKKADEVGAEKLPQRIRYK